LAPIFVNSSSEIEANKPAPFSTLTLIPRLSKVFAAKGVSETRCSSLKNFLENYKKF